MSVHTGLMAVHGAEEGAGVLTYWGLHGHVNRDLLVEAIQSYGLPDDMAPGSTADSRALLTALQDVSVRTTAHTQGVLVRTVREAREWALVSEGVVHADTSSAEHGSIEHTPLLHVVLKDDGPRFYQPPNGCERGAFWYDDTVDAVRQRFEHHSKHLSHNLLSKWMVSMASGYCAGVRMRDRGGIYFIPPQMVGLWQELCEVVDLCKGGDVYTIPVYRCDDAVRAVTAALANEVSTLYDEITRELNAGVTKRMARSRTKRCTALLNKVNAYNGILGAAAGQVGQKLVTLQAALTEVALRADDEVIQ